MGREFHNAREPRSHRFRLRLVSSGIWCFAAMLWLRPTAIGWFPMGSTQRGDVCQASAAAPAAQRPEALAEVQLHEAVEGLLASCWGSSADGFVITAEETVAIDAASPLPGRRASTYGEVTALGARQLGRALGLDSCPPGGHAYFMDLGCGVGKLVAQAYLETPAVARAVGVELSATRCRLARSCWSTACSSGEAYNVRSQAVALAGCGADGHVSPAEAVSFIEGNLLDADVREATHIYVASLCFDDAMLRKLARKLAAKEAPRLRAVATLRRFPLGVLGFEQAGSAEVQMSWTASSGAGATAYLYKRRADQ